MFEVIMIACNILGQCIGIEDTRGPYDTMAACEERKQEMRDFFDEHAIWPVPFAIDSKCHRQGGSREPNA